MTNEHTSLDKCTSHTLFERVTKGLCVRGELETEQTATYWPQFPLTIAVLLSHSAGLLNRGSWGPTSSAGSLFSLLRAETRTPTAWLQLTRTVCGTRLYNCLMSTCFLGAPDLHRIQPVHMSRWYLRPDAPVSRLTAGSKVNMLQLNTRGRILILELLTLAWILGIVRDILGDDITQTPVKIHPLTMV